MDRKKLFKRLKRVVSPTTHDNKRKYLTQNDFRRKYSKILGIVFLVLVIMSLFRLISGSFVINMMIILLFEMVAIMMYDFKKYVKKNKLAFKGLEVFYSDGTSEVTYFTLPSDYEEFVFDLTNKCNEHEVTVERIDRLK